MRSSASGPARSIRAHGRAPRSGRHRAHSPALVDAARQVRAAPRACVCKELKSHRYTKPIKDRGASPPPLDAGPPPRGPAPVLPRQGGPSRVLRRFAPGPRPGPGPPAPPDGRFAPRFARSLAAPGSFAAIAPAALFEGLRPSYPDVARALKRTRGHISTRHPSGFSCSSPKARRARKKRAAVELRSTSHAVVCLVRLFPFCRTVVNPVLPRSSPLPTTWNAAKHRSRDSPVEIENATRKNRAKALARGSIPTGSGLT